MGKMGEAANLGMVAIAAYVVYRLAGLKLPKFEWPKLEIPGLEIPIDLKIQEYRETSESFRDELEEHSTNLENILARDPFPIIPPLDIKPPEYYGEKLDIFKARATHFREVGDVLETGILAQLAAARALIGSNPDVDAGGSTDMDSSLTDVYWRAERPIPY